MKIKQLPLQQFKKDELLYENQIRQVSLTLLATAVLLIAFSSYADTSQALPQDVQAFIKRRDICDHFREEFTGRASIERDAEVIPQLNKYCENTDRDLKNLNEKYSRNVGIVKALEKYEQNIESK